MLSKKRLAGLVGLLLALPLAAWAQRGEYPAPRYPKLRQIKTAAELLPVARAVVKKPSRGTLFNIGYGIKPGEKALIVVSSRFDRKVLDALLIAIGEAGGKPDVMITNAPPVESADGSEEANRLLQPDARAEVGRSNFVMKMAELGRYDILIHGSGGPHPGTPYRWEYIPWNTVDKFITGVPEYTYELLEAIDQKAWDTLQKAKRVRATDPEGTDISWTVDRKAFEKAARRTGSLGQPSDIAHRGHMGAWPQMTFTESPDAEGTIAGTTNHTGVFPLIKLHIKNQRVVKVEGGGRYGELWQSLLSKYKDVQWPLHPGAGMGWLVEVAIGTHPKVARPVRAVEYASGITWERGRSGVIHWGIGLASSTGQERANELIEFAREKRLPLGHLHVHTYFTTIEVETQDGQKIKLIDKGRLKALDDPQVRQIAAKYGDPDELLREVWIPAIPGINAEGDYAREYGSGPGAWIREEHLKAYGDNAVSNPR